jgi:hypothetical protein
MDRVILKKFLKKAVYYWFPVVFWCSLIFYLSGIQNLRTNFGFWDLILRKLAHVTEYGVLYLLLERALRNSSESIRTAGRLSVVFALLYAVSDEIHQALVPTRGSSAADVGIDFIGISAAYLINLTKARFHEEKQ